MVWNEHGELLLVRNWGGKQQWGLPGGGVEKNETSVAAAKRELFEEIGIDLAIEKFTHVATIQYQYEAIIYTTDIINDSLPAQPYNQWEIIDSRWFSLQELPTDLSPLIPLALEKLSK
jgi:8-oxo-dGTP pyrophosphatase MutT (NUDIX family)